MKRLPLIVWFAILALATGLRIGPIGAGLPYSDYVDEGHVLHQVVTFLDKGTVNIGNYSYPWLPSFLITGAVSAYSPIYHAVQGRSLRSDLAIGSQASKSGTGYYDLISPSDLIVLGRLVVALLSVLTVVLTGWLGTKIAGPRNGFGRNASHCCLSSFSQPCFQRDHRLHRGVVCDGDPLSLRTPSPDS